MEYKKGTHGRPLGNILVTFLVTLVTASSVTKIFGNIVW